MGSSNGVSHCTAVFLVLGGALAIAFFNAELPPSLLDLLVVRRHRILSHQHDLGPIVQARPIGRARERERDWQNLPSVWMFSSLV